MKTEFKPIAVKADLVTYDLDYNEVTRTPVKSAVFTDLGITYDSSEINRIYGIPVTAQDGDLGSIAFWSAGNHGEPDCYLEYDANLHELLY